MKSKTFGRKALIGLLTILVVVPFGLSGTALAASTETVVSPVPTAGGSFDVPVVVPGANIVVTFTLAADGTIASATVAGAPDGATVVSTENGVKISYLDGQTPVTVEVEADIQKTDGVITGATVKTEYNTDTGNVDQGQADESNGEDSNYVDPSANDDAELSTPAPDSSVEAPDDSNDTNIDNGDQNDSENSLTPPSQGEDSSETPRDGQDD